MHIMASSIVVNTASVCSSGNFGQAMSGPPSNYTYTSSHVFIHVEKICATAPLACLLLGLHAFCDDVHI